MPLNTERSSLSAQSGFTLFEMVVQIGIFVVIAAFLTSVVFIVLRVRHQSVSSSEVSSQMHFVMQTIQRLIRDSSAATLDDNETLRLTRPAPDNPTIITKSGTAITLKEGTDAAAPLTSDEVIVENLRFIRITETGAPEVIHIETTFRYNSENPFASTTQTLQASASPLR